MKNAISLVALSACFFACQKHQANETRVKGEREAELSAREPALIESRQTTGKGTGEEMESSPTPEDTASSPTPVASITPEPASSVTATATETPVSSPTATPTSTVSSTPQPTFAQTPEGSEKPVATTTPRLRLNPLSTGMPFPQATASAEVDFPASSGPLSETQSRRQTTPTSSTSNSPGKSWIQSARGKTKASPSPSSSPPE